MADCDDVDLVLLRRRALESRKKDYDYDELLQLHPNEELDLSYVSKKKKKTAKKKVAERKVEKKLPKAKEDPLIHFNNPHGGFMPYSTLSLAVKQTQSVSNVSPISSESPSPVNLYSAVPQPKVMSSHSFMPIAQPSYNPIPVMAAATPQLPPAFSKPLPAKKFETAVQPKPVVAPAAAVVQNKELPHKKTSKAPTKSNKRDSSHSRSSSSNSTSSFSSSSASSCSSHSSEERHRRDRGRGRKRKSYSSSSSSRSSSSGTSSSSSRSSSSGSRHSRRHKRKPDCHSSGHRGNKKHPVERSKGHYKQSGRNYDDDSWQDRGSPTSFPPQREGYSNNDFQHRPSFGFKRDRMSQEGGRFQKQDYQRSVTMDNQKPYGRPYFRPNFNSPQVRDGNFRGRPLMHDRQFDRNQSHGFRQRFDNNQPNYGNRRSFTNSRYGDQHSPEHRQQRREQESSRPHRDSGSSYSRYKSKIGAPIKESGDHDRLWSRRQHHQEEDLSDPGQSHGMGKQHRGSTQTHNDLDSKLDFDPDLDSMLELDMDESTTKDKRRRNEPGREIDESYGSDDNKKVKSTTRSKPRPSSRTSSSGSSRSSSSSSSGSSGHSERYDDRRTSIKSPIRVSPDKYKQDYKNKRGEDIRRKGSDMEGEYQSTSGQKRFHPDTTGLEKVSKRLRPDLALRLGPDPAFDSRGPQPTKRDEYVSTRQQFYDNSSFNAPRTIKGNALEIARQFRLQKERGTSKKQSYAEDSSSPSVSTKGSSSSGAEAESPVKEISTDPEKERELSERIQKIKEQNEKILQRQREIENDIEQYA